MSELEPKSTEINSLKEQWTSESCRLVMKGRTNKQTKASLEEWVIFEVLTRGFTYPKRTLVLGRQETIHCVLHAIIYYLLCLLTVGKLNSTIS